LSFIKTISVGLWLYLLVHAGFSQDVSLDQIGSQQPIKVSGSVSTLGRFYTAFGIEDRQENFIGTISGRLNFDVFGIAVPLAATITTQNTSFTQPYNRLSIRPSYKWAKAHIGYSNMTYSSYTLAGHTFLGGGIELNPNKIRFAANYGRFATAIPLDRAINQPFVPSFDRFGYGGKIGYGDDNNFIDFTFFTAEDRQDSWESIPDSSSVFPGENMVVGTNFKLSLVKNLSISGEYARSAFTSDVRDDLSGRHVPFVQLGFDSRTSTVIRNAMKMSTAYRLASIKSSVSGTYERIDPGYQTMGAYFFNNDIENITAAFSTALFKSRLAIALNGGFQRNNLMGDKQSESRRTIASGSMTYAKAPYSLGITFSNFSSQVNFLLNQDLDSLNAVVVTQSITFFGNYLLTPKKSGDQHMLGINLSQQAVNDDFQSDVRSNDNNVLNGTISYTLRQSATKMEISARLNYNRNDLNGIINSRIGPGISAKRRYWQDKLNTQLTVNYFLNEGNRTLTTLFNASTTLNSKHVLGANISYIQRSITTGGVEGAMSTTSFGEAIATLNYTYTF